MDEKLDNVERVIYYKMELFRSFLTSDMDRLIDTKVSTDMAIHCVHNDIRSLEALTVVLRTYREFKNTNSKEE